MTIRRAFSFCLLGVTSCLAQFADVRTIDQKLNEQPEILVNSQGLAQHDLSIRGGSYTGSGLAINGLRLKSAWSSHYNSELPMIGSQLSVPTLGTGLNNVSGHLVGTAHFNTQPLSYANHHAVGVGTEERYAATTYGSAENVGGYLDWEKARRVDYSPNDLERFTGGAFLQFITDDDWQFDAMLASQSKEFGAQGYYEAPSTVEAEQQLDDGLILGSATKGDLDDAYFRATASYRDLRDQYTVPTSAFYQDITSRNAGFAVEGRTMEVQNIALNLRGDLEHERVSGDTKKDDRTRSSFLVMPEVRFERVTLKAGLNSVFQTSESADFLPMAGIDWFVSDNGRLYLSYSETEQQPDYQLLYAATPFMTGNAALQQQQSQNTELGFKHFLSASCDWRVGTFFRTLENANDWIGGTATDLGRLNVAGIDSAISYYPSENLQLKAYYQWIHKDNELENGLYETDYPEHMLNLSAYWQFLNEFAVQFAQTTRWQADNAVRTSDDFGAIASLGLHYDPRFAKNVRLSFLVDNLWGSNFQSVPGLKPRPATLFTGIAIGW
ncbi:TonB-dependent receptor [Pontiellaceae bacterium B12227]|nr:TonB-dependent receptor [Pontiellaceae bacterium B12227]